MIPRVMMYGWIGRWRREGHVRGGVHALIEYSKFAYDGSYVLFLLFDESKGTPC